MTYPNNPNRPRTFAAERRIIPSKSEQTPRKPNISEHPQREFLAHSGKFALPARKFPRSDRPIGW